MLPLSFHVWKDYLKHRAILKQIPVQQKDTFLASYPKSGNTWLRFVIARAMFPENKITQRNLTEYFPAMHKNTADHIRAIASPRFIKTHYPFFSLYTRSVYIYRDYRDAAISNWHHIQRMQKYTGSFSQFIRSNYTSYYCSWPEHLKRAFQQKEENRDSILLLRYEDLRTNPEAEIKRVLEYCQIEPIIPITEIVRLTEFEELKKMEAKTGSKMMDKSGQPFFRQGQSGKWKEQISESDLSYIYQQKNMLAMLQKTGYLATT
jgi:estrone sulfotransferase